MGTFIPSCHIYSMNINKHKGYKMTKKNMIAHIEERFNKMDWFITYHQDKADEGLLLANKQLREEGLSLQEYNDCKGMIKHDSHSQIVEIYKHKKDMLNEILTEITGNFYGGKELLTKTPYLFFAEEK